MITPDGTKLCEELQLCNWYKTSAKKGTGLNEAVECLVENVCYNHIVVVVTCLVTSMCFSVVPCNMYDNISLHVDTRYN